MGRAHNQVGCVMLGPGRDSVLKCGPVQFLTFHIRQLDCSKPKKTGCNWSFVQLVADCRKTSCNRFYM